MSMVMDFLKSYKAILMQIEIIENELEELEAQAESIAPISDGMPKEKVKTDKTGDLAALIADTRIQLDDKRTELIDKRARILELIQAIPDYRYSTLLYKRYIQFDSWYKISEDMHYGGRYTFQLHSEALDMAESLLPQCSANMNK